MCTKIKTLRSATSSAQYKVDDGFRCSHDARPLVLSVAQVFEWKLNFNRDFSSWSSTCLSMKSNFRSWNFTETWNWLQLVSYFHAESWGNNRKAQSESLDLTRSLANVAEYETQLAALEGRICAATSEPTARLLFFLQHWPSREHATSCSMRTHETIFSWAVRN